MRALACWDFGFESWRMRRYLSVVSVECCQVEFCATGWSLVQRNPADCGVSNECDREAPHREATTWNPVEETQKKKQNSSRFKEPAISKVLWCVAESTMYLYATRANSVRPGVFLQRCSKDKQAYGTVWLYHCLLYYHRGVTVSTVISALSPYNP
jgi:hypothetical protein